MKTLFGDQSERCCGFCKLHGVGVTPNQIKNRHCISPNQCKHFRKIKDAEFWEEEAARQIRIAERKTESKKNRQKRKAVKKAYFEKLDKERAKHVHTPKPKPPLSRGTPGRLVAVSESDIIQLNPFAILATKIYPADSEIEPDEPCPFDEPILT